ncbi:PKD domain-containing protein [Spirosoma validum]|uniref:PKD domain-containing protein n=1 Tax=Spirosoma validum TaxID=2771355 RepID=A0A927AZG1_9BACT|nr:PKD domain-containing protein [Spirosoma validum]MBD2752623.1 PKD domain-containing protein [Spirosoma validum]
MKSTFTLLFCLAFLFNSCSPKETPRPAPKAVFNWSSSGNGIIQFTDQSTEADSYVWNFGDGSPTSTEKSPKHTFEKNAKYTVTLSVKNPTAGDQTSKDVEVSSFAAPVASFTMTSGEDGQMTFTNTSTNALSYSWDLGNGSESSSVSPSVKYTENKKYTVTLTAAGKGGAVKTSREIEIGNVKPIVDFTWTNSNGQVTFNNKTKNADSYSWDFGNGNVSTEASPVYKYTRSGSYNVKLTAKGKGGEVSKTTSILIPALYLSLADVVDDPGLVNFLPGVWGAFVKGEGKKYDNYTYEFSKASNIMNYKNTYNPYVYIDDIQTTSLVYQFGIVDKVISVDGSVGKTNKYARFQPISDDEMRLFRIIETATSYTELLPIILTRTSNLEKEAAAVVNSPALLATLKGVWDQGSYSIYTDVFFDFSAGKNYYSYNSSFQGAKSIDKYEYKIDANNVLSYRRWNSSFDPAWKKYKVEVVSTSMLKLYSVDANGKASSQADYTLQKR